MVKNVLISYNMKLLDVRQSQTGTQIPFMFLTKPSKHMQAGTPQTVAQPETSNLSHLRWQPSSPQPEYISFVPHVIVAKNTLLFI